MDPTGGGRRQTAMEPVCGSCGAHAGATAKFCSQCGTSLDALARSVEYKQVTVLIADVVHWMDIAAAVGPERLREITAGLVNRAAAVVQRLGGTVDKFTGDGIMAVFGAPVALEDHAFRACLAALGVQEETKRLAVDVRDRDGLDLAMRIGLNSGQVIVGEIGSGPFSYTAIGEQVGMAQRMESVAPPGGVMLSASTARLVEAAVSLGGLELVRIKGADEPVPAYRLMGMREGEGHGAARRAESRLVGRRWEMSAVEDLLGGALDGHGTVVGLVGSPGIGKSRLVREVSAMAGRRGMEVFTTFCESHTSEMPFHAVARLLRAVIGVKGLDGQNARDRVRKRLPFADPEDLLLLNDLLGITDPDAAVPTIDPDARRRRLTALLNAALLARETSAVYVVEDAHWIDETSESMVAEFLTVIARARALVLVTYRPEYRGALSRLAGAQYLALAPLSSSEASALVAELLGEHPSIAKVGRKIAESASGNPFFVEEIVRELAERDVLCGKRGGYESTAEVAEVTVPATLQATIAARIDRLDHRAKRTLSAAAVIGSRFSIGILQTLGIDPVLDELVNSEFIDQVTSKDDPKYVFHHPLVRTVAYESQLKSDRADLHRRVAAALEAGELASVDENAALIAEHLEAAGDLRAAFDWRMRAGSWSTNRDLAAARLSWERARHVADRLSSGDPDRKLMRVAPRTLLCATAWRVGGGVADTGIDELRQLATEVGDKKSLALGMSGLLVTLAFNGEFREAARAASEYVDLLDSIGNPEMTVGLLFGAIAAKWESGESVAALQLAERVIDGARGDPNMGSMIVGSPLALALSMRSSVKSCLGQADWKDDLDSAVAMARSSDSFSRVLTIMFKSLLIGYGALLPDAVAIRETAEALDVAERSGDDFTLANARLARGALLVLLDGRERRHGWDLLNAVRRAALEQRFTVSVVWFIDILVARDKSRAGDIDAAIELSRNVVNEILDAGNMIWSGLATAALVESLLQRAGQADLDEAQSVIDRLAAVPTDPGFVLHALPLLRLRALLAHARGDDTTYRDYRDRYRNMARITRFEGHIEWAKAMTSTN